MRTLFITDLDGTLLDDNAQVSNETARTISSLTREGVLISVATARTPATIEPLLAKTETCSELVVMTGAAIWDRRTSRFAEIRLVPEAEVPVMLDVFDRRGMHPFCYVLNDDDRYLDVYHATPILTPTEEVFVEERAQLTLKGFHLGVRCPEAEYGRVALFFGMGDKDTIIGVAEELRDVSSCYISYYKDTYSPDMWLLEIFGPGVSKAAGVERLRRRLDVDRVVAFGDNLNDILMLEAADLGVAVGNALDEVKAIADVVIGPNTENSVAKFILNFTS